MKKQIKDFIGIAIFLGVALVVFAVLGDEGVIRNALNGVINWVATSFGLAEPNLF